MDIKNKISELYEHYQNENYKKAIKLTEKLLPEVNKEIQGVLYFLESNCYLKMEKYQEAYDFCKKAADRGNNDAVTHLPQIETLIELRS